LTGASRVLPFGTQADPRGSGHGRHSIYRSESGKPTAIKSVNGVFALTLTIDPIDKRPGPNIEEASSWKLQLDDSSLQANHCCMRSIIGTEFRKDALHPTFDGFLGDRELIGDLLIGISGGDQA